jgi:beta-lactamase regulating signal transducer with metallopeptidase domain/protein involved in polysaccharide export with SLBB domain
MLSIEAGYELLLRWAAMSCAVGGIAVIALWLTREPARRIRIIQGTFVGLALLPLLMIAPGYPRLAVLPDVGLLDNAEEQRIPTFADSQNETVDSPPHPNPPRGEREILLPSPLVGEGGLRSKPGEGGTAGTAKSQGRSSAQSNIPLTAAPVAAAPPHSDPLPRGEREKSAHTWSYRDAIVAAYLTGLVSMLAWMVLGLVAVWRLLRSARPAPLECRILLKSLGGPRTERVSMVVSPRVAQPCAVAGWRTTIVLPEALVTQQDPQALRWALAHEWSHVERGDLPWWLASGFVRAVYFYQPLVWWLRGQLQLSQDFLADGAAAGLSHSPEDYAEFLTTSSFTRPTLAAGLGIGGRISDLQRRVVMLVDRRRPLERVSPRSWNLATIVAVMLVVGVAAGLAPEEPGPEAGGGKSGEVATQATPAPAPSSAPAPTAAPPGGTAQPTPIASPTPEPTPKSEEKPSGAPKFNPTPSNRRVPDLAPAIPEGLIELELRKDPAIEQLMRRAADMEAQLVAAQSAPNGDQVLISGHKTGLALLNRLIDEKKAALRSNIVEALSARRGETNAWSSNNPSTRPIAATTAAPSLGTFTLAPSVPDAKRKIQPGDVLSVVVLDNLDQLPALGSRLLLYPKTSEVIATVDSEGEILLGTRYGTVKVVDMTLLQASAFVSNVIQQYVQMRGQQERQRILKSEVADDAEKQAQKIKAQAIEDALRRLEVNVRVSLAGTSPERTPIPTQTYAPATALPGVPVTGSATGPVPITLPAPRMSATPTGPTVAPYPSAPAFQLPPDTIIPGDVLNIECEPSESRVKPVVTVEPDGRIALGVRYGRVNVGGKSLTEAEEIIRSAVAKLMEGPVVQVTFGKRGGY